MKKKLLFAMLCSVILIGLTGCGSQSSTDKKTDTVSIICNEKKSNDSLGVVRNIELTTTFENTQITRIDINSIYEFSKEPMSKDDIEKDIDSSLSEFIKLTDAKKELSYGEKKSIAKITIDYTKLTEEEKEKLGVEGLTIEEFIDKRNNSRNMYCYQDNKETSTIPSSIDGEYIDDISDEESADYKTVYNFNNGRLITYILESNNEHTHENEMSYEYENGKLSITNQHNGKIYTTEYTVKSNYKGYDIVLLDKDNNDEFRGNRK